MSGFPRDLAVLEPWELSVVRSGELRVWAGGADLRSVVIVGVGGEEQGVLRNELWHPTRLVRSVYGLAGWCWF